MPPRIGDLVYPKKPPRYWLAAKRQAGVSDAGAGRIWWRIYTEQKRLAAWLDAPPEEWREHGTTKPV